MRTLRIALGYLALISGQLGVWALIAPRSFYDGFPGLGRAWVAVDGPFNEHLVRDVGGLNLALTVVIVAAAIWPTKELVVVAGAASLVWGATHLVYHLTTLSLYGFADAAASIVGLTVFVVFAIMLIMTGRQLSPNKPTNTAVDGAAQTRAI